MILLRLLILDDEVVICKTIEMMVGRIKEIGPVETFLANDGLEALEILKKQAIDIILVDLSMEEMDGLTFIEKVMQEEEPPQIIVVSAYGDYEYVRSAFKFGVFDYIMKPIDFRTLQSTLVKCYDNIKTSDENNYDIIAKVKAYVSNNLENDISMMEVAKHVSMDYSYFSKYFKSMTGESFLHFVTTEKMETCKRLLRETDIKINVLAIKMGYNNTGNFSRAFRNYTGKWPTEYQREEKREYGEN